MIRHIAPDWQIVGAHLGIEMSILRIIEADNPRSVERCCCQMFLRWLSHDTGTGSEPRTWKSVLIALRTVGYYTMVGDIERTLNVHIS